jgi:hypothetical protein
MPFLLAHRFPVFSKSAIKTMTTLQDQLLQLSMNGTVKITASAMNKQGFQLTGYTPHKAEGETVLGSGYDLRGKDLQSLVNRALDIVKDPKFFKNGTFTETVS